MESCANFCGEAGDAGWRTGGEEEDGAREGCGGGFGSCVDETAIVLENRISWWLYAVRTLTLQYLQAVLLCLCGLLPI